MKVSLKAEGWKEDQRLPKGWMVKIRKSTAPRTKVSDTPNENNNEKIEECRLQFLNEEAEVMSAADSLEHLISQNPSEEDLQVFRALLADVTRIQKEGKNKKEVAKAKKSKHQEEKCVLKDDDRDIKLGSENASVNCPGNVFSQNLEMEVTENLNEMANVTKETKMETVERQEDGDSSVPQEKDSAGLNKGLRLEGWKEDERLPEGWKMMVKRCKDGKGFRDRKFFRAKDGSQLKSFRDAVKFLKASPDYTEDDVSKILALNPQTLACDKEKRKAKIIGTVKEEKVDLEKGTVGLPEGSKTETTVPGGKNENFEKPSVPVESNIKNNDSAEKSVSVECTMKINDSAEQSGKKSSWTNHPLLPEGWMMKALDSDKKIIFQTKDKTRMSVLAALRFMKSSPDFGPEEICRLQQIIKEFRPNTSEPLNHSEWTSHPKLPAGFQVKLLPTKGKLLFRADGNSPGLGKFAVIKSMMSSGNYKSEDADAIKVVAEELEDQLVNLLVNQQHNEKGRKKKIVEEAVWISDDPTVPTGWKISPGSGRFGRCLLSPDGVQMRNRCLG